MGKQYHILYVDDEPDNLIAFKAVFRRHYHIYTAQGGEEAIQLLQQQAVDLIISDQRMPKMTGVELFEKILPDFPDVIRMILTGFSDLKAIIDAINKGKVYYYITKPWKVEELKIILDNALELSHLRKKAIELEKQNMMAQFQMLKNQINPHFLFNSMNALASLINTNQKLAIEFTRKFSKLYRSVLELKDQWVISLEEELEFVNAYFFLQKMRFEENLKLDINISTEKLNRSVPPFALQTLIENAVKHNMISDDQPLLISVSTENECLIVSNNLQLRTSVEDSTGTGLRNLEARYALIGAEKPVFEEAEDQFIAKIPLID